MTMTGSMGVMTYERTPEIRARQSAAQRGRKQPPEAIAKRTATRKANKVLVTHGLSKTPTYNSWSTMIQRCTNPKAPGYQYYGGRGIVVCDRWRDSFAEFLADMGVRPGGTSLDRIDGNGNYEPGNCRWATKDVQMANRPRSRHYDRPSRTPECGHPDRPHKARGMCGACYLRWRLSKHG